ncbi:hypothetical protein B7990_04515 [Fibrobacter sp. UWB4]|uniref:hypothetical protein n=1 Tax=Fibrobacter sp. UWB4 TaxID=1964356 RepID=UPI000B5236AA|nr:hypothetical protein [Fibrobacter sp. UWB4]MBR6124625.1 hypothetical protein [Candidatus Saccharibacteria bacterium]OWV20430.1 hypothetical protein B7990_04515 [Fibrobacter sp. UWB4]
MKFVESLFAIAALLVFSACSSTPHTLVGNPVNPKPLSKDDLVRIVDATEIPVVPENSTYLGTMQTEPSADCSVENTAELLVEKARSLGANMVYIKNVKTINFIYSNGMMTMSRICKVALVDYFNVEEWGAK